MLQSVTPVTGSHITQSHDIEKVIEGSKTGDYKRTILVV